MEDEYITSVKGHFGTFGRDHVITTLTFETNKNKTFGPFGRENGFPFEFPSFGGKIIVFHGRSGLYLDVLGVYVQVYM